MARRWVTVAIMVTGTAALILLALAKASGHRLEIKTYLADAHGLRRGAQVAMAGVTIGTVTSVRVRPELHERPAEVIMLLNTPYELDIPKDAVVSVSTMGLMGESFADIDIKDSSAPPLENGGTLKSRESAPTGTADIVERLQQILQNQSCAARSAAAEIKGGKKP